jgi:hypothetical protein
MADRQAQLLRTAFLAGALTDALAVIPMLSQAMAHFILGFEDVSEPYRFAMGYAAALMTGWTALLLWAYQRPIERAFVAVLTMFVVVGLVTTEIVSVLFGTLTAVRMMPTWILQAMLLCLFAFAYFYPFLKRQG